jgi:hypothetical protein
MHYHVATTGLTDQVRLSTPGSSARER